MGEMLIGIGQFFLDGCSGIGRFYVFLFRLVVASFTRPFYFKSWCMNLWTLLFSALPLVCLASLCTGMVLTFQTGDGFDRFGVGNEFALPEIVSLSMVRELAPVLTGLMMAGRWSASITSELASMRLTSQIDALVTLSISPMRYLVVPRFLAAALAMPLIVLVCVVAGVMGGYLVVMHSFPSIAPSYIVRSLSVLTVSDCLMCLQKALFFGLSIACIATYSGWSVKGGSQELGQSTTRSVVYSGLLVLTMNFLITSLWV